MESNVYDRLTSKIYKAGAGQALWSDALADVSDVFGLWGVQIVGVDKASMSLAYSLEGGPAKPEATIDYIRHYHQINPRIAPALAVLVSEWMHCHEHFDDDYVATSPFCQDFLIPYGGRYLSSLKLIDDDSIVVMVGALRGVARTPLNQDEVAQFSRLGNHLVSSLQIFEENRRKRSKTAAGHHLLERMRQPIVLLDEYRKIQYRNPAADALLRNNGAVSEDRGYLRCQRTEEDQRLHGEVKRILSNRHVDTATDRAVVRVRTQGTDSPILAMIDKLLPDPTLRAFGDEPLAFVVLHSLSAAAEIDPFVVAKAYGLTPAEAQVAILLAQGLSPAEIADKRNVTLLTVRSQVKVIREKMGARNQTDLVRQLQQLPSLFGFEHR